MTDPSRVPLPSSPLASPARSPFSPVFSPTSNHQISPLAAFTPLPSSTPHSSQHAATGSQSDHSRQHTGGSSTPYHAHRPSLAPSESVSAAPSRRSSSHSHGFQGGMSASYLRSMSPAGQGPFRPRLDRQATIRRDMGQSVMQQPQDPFYEGVTIEVNQPVGSLSISPSNRDVCLASRKGLYIIDLANLHNAPRFVPQGGTWQIADCQWSPHPATSNMILSTSSQKLLVWDLAAQVALRHSVDAHARAITDINWHARDPNLMATASMDAGIRGWDLRCLNRPYMRVCAWGEAVTQIKWNRQHDHLFATAHGKEVLVWDNRKGSVPVVDFKAHDAKIYGIDWDREHRHKLVTCSLDQTVKYWTVSDLRTFGDSATHTFYPQLAPPSQASSVINTGYPVWRARNLPFGHGVIALPQRGGEDLEMFALGNDKPVHTFEGHTDVVKDFVWRSRGGEDAAFENREFQLVTWSKDQTLRIWPVSREVTETVGYQYGAPITVLVSRRGAQDITYTTTHRADDKQVVPPTIVNQPSGIAKARAAAHPVHGHAHDKYHREAGGMTRGGGKMKVVDQLDWLTKVIKNKASPEASAWPSRMGSVSARGSRSGSRDRIGRGVSQGPGFERTGTMGTSATGAETMSLKDEIVIVNQLFPRPKVRFEKIDLQHKKLTISMSGPWANGDRMAFCRIHWSFPAEYPDGAEMPTFELERNPTVSSMTRQKLVMTLKEIRAADKQCLVQTCAFLLGQHEASRSGRGRRVEEDSDSESEAGSATGMSRHVGGKIGTNVVMMIRNCGATFGPNGQLVCFFPKRTVLPRIRALSHNPAAINALAGQGAATGREQPPLAKAMSALSSLSRPDIHGPRSHRRSQLALRRARMGITMGIGAALGFTDNSVATVQAGSTVTIHSLDLAGRHTGSVAVGESADGYNRILAKEYGVPAHPRDIQHFIRVAEKHKRIDHLQVLHALWGAIGGEGIDDDDADEHSPPPAYSRYPREYESSGSRDRWEHSLARRKRMVDQVFQTLIDNRDIQMLALVSCFILLHIRSDPPPPHLLDPREQVTTVSPVQDYFALPLPRNVSQISQPTPVSRSRNSVYANSQGYPSPLMMGGGPTSAPGYGHPSGQIERHQRGSSAPHGAQGSTSGTWALNPSSLSLRALGAMTPRDRGSFDMLARTPFGMSFDLPSPNLGTGTSVMPALALSNSLMGKGKSPRLGNFSQPSKALPSPLHRDSDLGVQIQERPRHPIMGRRQRLNSRAGALAKEERGSDSGAETPKAQPRSTEAPGDITPTVRPGSGSAFTALGYGYGQSGIYSTVGSAPLRSAGTERSFNSGNGSYGRSGFQQQLQQTGAGHEQEVGSAGSAKWFGSPARRKVAGPGQSSVDLRSQVKGERDGSRRGPIHKICDVRIEIIQPGQDRFDHDPRHAPINAAYPSASLQSVSATLLPPERLAQCEIWKNVYADLLLRSELYILRAEMLQFDFVAASKERPRIGKQAADPDQSGIACVTCTHLGRECCACGTIVGARAAQCSYCRLAIKGLYTTCTLCAHRTHLSCYRLHTGLDDNSPTSSDATCAACPCKCLSEGGLTGAALPYGPPPPEPPVLSRLDMGVLPYDDTSMGMGFGGMYETTISPGLATAIPSTVSAYPADQQGQSPDQFPFPTARRSGTADRDRDRERDRDTQRGLVGLRGKGRRGGTGEGSPRRSTSTSGRAEHGQGRSASTSGISGLRLGRTGAVASPATTSATGTGTGAVPPVSNHARGLANIGAIGGQGLGLGLGLKSVAEQDTPMPSPNPAKLQKPTPTKGRPQGQSQVQSRTQTQAQAQTQPSPDVKKREAVQQKGWSSIYGYANPYGNLPAQAEGAAPASTGQGKAQAHGQEAGRQAASAEGQGQAQGAQGLLARARAAMDAGGAWR